MRTGAEGPDDFDRRIVAGLGRYRILGCPELRNNENEQDENEKRDGNDKPQGILFKPTNFVHDWRCGLLQSHLPILRLVSAGADSREQTDHARKRCVNPSNHGTSPSRTRS